MIENNDIEYKTTLKLSGKNIYSPIEIGDPDYWIPTDKLETMLNSGLCGISLSGLAIRTRSKVVKAAVCEALGYLTPSSFKKTQPRFSGQQLDIYVQKSLNLQIWNEELSPMRRYAIIQVTENDVIRKVKVVTGQQLAFLDKTGTVTTKYQARLNIGTSTHELVSPVDTFAMWPHISAGAIISTSTSPIDEPKTGGLLPIQEIFERLSSLVGYTFSDPGVDQERNRGALLHRLICEKLGYSRYEDTGQFPDIRQQLLEVKLQTSPTIDLGLIQPSSMEYLDIRRLGTTQPRHCDVRYALFYATTNGKTVVLTHLLVTTGENFFTRFRRFEGRVINGKIQIPLSRSFFS